jgi:2-dehydro-3-deoxygalactonokinase
MRWSEGFITADWGTTNRRAYLIDASGRCIDEFDDGKGILSIARGGFAAAVAEIRERLGDWPLLLAGMVGSNRGWIEAPYVRCSAGFPDITNALAWPEPGRTAIVPGVSFRDADEADVMRGEEVQLLGAFAAGLVTEDAMVCHPGTHNKWVRLQGGRIQRFTTVMTGELFNLLKEHSILSDLLSGTVEPGDAFARGVRRGLDDDRLTAELFKIRARVLLGEAEPKNAASYGSGLLIGTDVRTGLGEGKDKEIYVLGSPKLTALYAEALRIAGRQPQELDGEQAFLAGAKRIVELIDERS